MRVAVAGILHESNTFATFPTGRAQFEHNWTTGAEMLRRWSDTHHELTGFLQGSAEAGFDVLPLLAATATPGGVVTADVYEALLGQLLVRLELSAPLDGMLLSLHGAMVSEEFPDGDGEIVRRVRELLGPDIPLVLTLDFHTNLSQKMVDHTTATLIYRTNPHIDQRPRGLKAARLLKRIMDGEVHPVQALAKPPMVWNILHQNTSAEPLRSILADAAELEDSDGMLAVSLAAGYPYADVEEMGPSVVVVSDGDPARARKEADRLSERMWDARDQLAIHLPDSAEAVRRACASDQTPVVIVEMGDNIGGGSPGDSTAILSELVRQGAPRAVSVIYDPAAAAQVIAAGVGASVDLEVGGKTDRMHGDPVRIQGVVKSIHDGKFHEPEPRHGGQTDWDQGPTAIVEIAHGTLVVLDSRRTAPMSLHQITSLGIKPEEMQILVVKAAIAYRAAYEPIAGSIVEADTPGVSAVNPARFEYRHRRRPLWPLDGE